MNYLIEIMLFKRYIPYTLLSLFFLSCTTQKETAKQTTENTKVWGIDISHYQEVFDWERLKEHEPGFIFVKATEGTTIQDPKYTEYYKAIRKLDIPVGSYHFFTYKTSGKDQAKNFLSIAKLQRGDLPLVLDAEFAKTMPDKKTINKEISDFITAVYNKTKQYPIIYCAYKYYLLYLKDTLPKKCKLWIVDYRGKPDCDWTFWQITERYKIAGIKGYVDYNLFRGSKKDLENMRL
jgi:lysozyme